MNDHIKISQIGLDLIKQFEGFRGRTYKCSAGVPTIGYGHTAAAGYPDPEAYKGTMTEEKASELLDRDLDKYEAAVRKAIKVPMHQPHFDAMVSLCYNIGGGGFASSSVVRRYNQGDIQGAADAILMWNRAGGKVLKGLQRRREAERDVFLGDGVETMPQAIDTPDEDKDGDGIIDVAKVGKMHPSIAYIHLVLKDFGFDATPYKFYSQQTARMVRAFQADAGIQSDGIFGPGTRRAMEERLGHSLADFIDNQAA